MAEGGGIEDAELYPPHEVRLAYSQLACCSRTHRGMVTDESGLPHQ